jgi:hypothetical protein
MLHAVLEEAEGAIVKVEQYSHTIAVVVCSCLIATVFAVAVDATFASFDEPAVSTFPPPV